MSRALPIGSGVILLLSALADPASTRYHSGTSLLTLGFGDIVATTTVLRLLTLAIALVIGRGGQSDLLARAFR
jgi:hypothetical protein